MKKTIKFISISLAVILLLLVISPIIIAMFVDPNDYKDEISKLVKDKTGRTLTIQGNINYSVFPWLGINLGELQLSNSTVKGFSTTPFAKIKSADVRIKIIPLFSSKIEVDKIVLDGLNLSLEKNSNGVTNWQDLVAKVDKTTAPPSNTTKPTKSKDHSDVSTTMILPAIAGIELVNANILWHDKQLNQQYQIKDFNFTTGVIANNTPSNININFSFKTNQPELSGSTDLTATMEFNIENKSLKINNLKLTQKINQQFQKPNNVALTLSVAEVNANLQKQIASISKLKLSVFDVELTGSFKATKILGNINVTGNLSTNEFNPKDILKTLEIVLPKMADSKVLQKAKLDVNVTANSKKLSLTKLAVKFDDTKLTGNLSVANFSKPQLRYNVHITEINVDRYLPPPQKATNKKTPTTTTAKNAVPTAIVLPIALLSSLDVKGKLTLDKTTVSRLHSKDIKLSILAKNGILRAYPISAKMYQGQYRGDITLNVQRKVPVITMNESITGVSFKPLVIDYMGKEYLSGQGTASAKLTTKGLTTAQFTKNLNGTVSFNITDAKIKYLNVKHLLKKEIYKFMKKPFKDKERFDNPNVFTIMEGSFQIKNGIAHNQDFITESRDINLNGKGYVDLVRRSVNYDANIIIQKDIRTGNKTIDKELKLLTKQPIPTLIRGPFTNISVKPKVHRVLINIHKAKIKKDFKKKVDAEKQKLKAKQKELERKEAEKLKKKIKDKFKNLFK